MTKSILKHKIQTLTGKNIKQLEEAMGYKVNTKLLLNNSAMYLFCLISAQGSQRDEYGCRHDEKVGFQLDPAGLGGAAGLP